MCFHCPDCQNADNDNECDDIGGCQDYLGTNMKLMGGYAGLATAMAFAIEYQGEATPHGHGFVSLANIYQHNNLHTISTMIQRSFEVLKDNAKLLNRIENFVKKQDKS